MLTYKTICFIVPGMAVTVKQRERAHIVLTQLKQYVGSAKMILQYSNQFELLVAVILSAQCTDKKVNEVTRTLFKKYKTLDDYVNTPMQELQQDIKSTGYYKSKAMYIQNSARMIKDMYHGELPKTMQEMIKLPGVGRKTANVVLGNAYQVYDGIAVDTHVKRLSRKFKLTKSMNPQKIEQDLMILIPKKDWFTFTYMMIEYGRQYSPSRLTGYTDPISLVLKKHGLI